MSNELDPIQRVLFDLVKQGHHVAAFASREVENEWQGEIYTDADVEVRARLRLADGEVLDENLPFAVALALASTDAQIVSLGAPDPNMLIWEAYGHCFAHVPGRGLSLVFGTVQDHRGMGAMPLSQVEVLDKNNVTHKRGDLLIRQLLDTKQIKIGEFRAGILNRAREVCSSEDDIVPAIAASVVTNYFHEKASTDGCSPVHGFIIKRMPITVGSKIALGSPEVLVNYPSSSEEPQSKWLRWGRLGDAIVRELAADTFGKGFDSVRGKHAKDKVSLDELSVSEFSESPEELFLREEARRELVKYEKLSSQEAAFLELKARGFSRQEIADQLHVSLKQVRQLRKRVEKKREILSQDTA